MCIFFKNWALQSVSGFHHLQMPTVVKFVYIFIVCLLFRSESLGREKFKNFAGEKIYSFS